MMNTPELRKQGSLNKLLPAYRFTIRDGTHAGRRIIARGWGADKNLKHTAGVFGRYRHSLGQRLHHRPKYRQIFQKHVTKPTFGAKKRVFNMRAAKHRMETWAKPSGRTVVYWKPSIRCALEVHHGDDREASKDMAKWLKELADHKACVLGGHAGRCSRRAPSTYSAPRFREVRIEYFVASSKALHGKDEFSVR